MTTRQRATFATPLVVSLVFVCLSLPITLLLKPRPPSGSPRVSGIQGVGFEEDIRLDRRTEPRLPERARLPLFGHELDLALPKMAARRFKWVTAATAKEGKPTSCGGGGDTELAVDSGGNLYFNDLTLVNFSTARSGNHGVSFTNGCRRRLQQLGCARHGR